MGRPKKPEAEKVSKPGVSLNAECRDILRRVMEYELGVHRNEMTYSLAVRKCLRIAWEKHYERLCVEYERDSDLALVREGNDESQPHSGPVIVKPHKQSAGGLKTREVRYQAKRRGRS
jgi:hypothetical protein